jgi:predicted permease
MLTAALRELSRTIRTLSARPGFAITVLLTLAVAIGANTLVFALIDGVYLSPLPYRDAEQLVDVYASSTKRGGGADNVSIPDYIDQRAGVPALSDIALYTNASLNLVDTGAPERLRGLRATASLFSTLGVGAALGRTFGEDEAVAGRDRVVVLTDTLWRNRFNADPNIVGRDLRLDGENYRVIGVMRPEFMFPSADTGFFVPFTFRPEDRADDQRFVNFSSSVGRLAPGATSAEVEAQCNALIWRNVERIGTLGENGGEYAQTVEASGFQAGVRALREQLSGQNASELIPLQAAVAMVLLIACANLANLLLTRLSSRHNELAVRTALGASRARIVRELSMETLLLSLAGAVLGMGLAWIGVRLVAASGLLPSWAAFGMDYRVLAFTFGIALLAGAVFGALPIWSMTAQSTQSLMREGTRLAGGARGARRTRNVLVVVQLALSVALLASAGLLLRSFENALDQDPGFRSDHVLIAGLTLPPAKYPDAPAQARHLRQTIDAVRTLPGIEAAGATTRMPFSGENSGIIFRIDGRVGEGSQLHAAWRSVDEDYFKAMRIPLVRGRMFSRADWDSTTRPIVVDAAFEHNYFPNGNAIGQRIFLGDAGTDEPYTIVGVVGSVKHFDLTMPASKPTFYFDLGSRPAEGVYLAVRTTGPSGVLVDALRAAVRSVDPEQPLFNVATLDQRISMSLAGRRVPLVLIGLFAAVAVLLAAIGIYGVLAFTVAQRISEIGVRVALGATRSRILQLVVADGGRLIAIGLAVGLLCAVALGRLLQSRLFGVGSIDPVTLAAVVLGFAAIALFACWLPARRAANTDPIVALRYE